MSVFYWSSQQELQSEGEVTLEGGKEFFSIFPTQVFLLSQGLEQEVLQP